MLIHNHLELSVRGAVTVGKVVHNTEDGDIIYGPAFIDAVELEKKAHFPRVILSEEILKNLKLTKFVQSDELPGIRKDIDNQNFLDHLALAKLSFTNKARQDYIDRIHLIILKLLEKSKEDSRISSKALWYATYYNQFVKTNYPETHQEIVLYP